MKFKLTVFCAMLLNLATVFAADKGTVLLTRTYKLRIQAGQLVCRNGVPPNGHNYPVYTNINFSLPHYDLWLSNVWTNIDNYSAVVQFRPCSDFADILKPSDNQQLTGTVTQKITEHYARNGFKDCMRVTREEATLKIKDVSFNGVNEFLLGPVNSDLCN